MKPARVYAGRYDVSLQKLKAIEKVKLKIDKISKKQKDFSNLAFGYKQLFIYVLTTF